MNINNGSKDENTFVYNHFGLQPQYTPKNLAFNLIDSRRRSFANNWDKSMPVNVKELSEAGFYSIGINDYVKCFYCDGGLCDWKPGNQPWVEHAKWFPDCPFVKMNKSVSFIEECKRLTESENSSNGSNIIDYSSNPGIRCNDSSNPIEEFNDKLGMRTVKESMNTDISFDRKWLKNNQPFASFPEIHNEVSQCKSQSSIQKFLKTTQNIEISEELIYRMTSKTRGYCLIFNNFKFKNLASIPGNKSLQTCFEQTFTQLNFIIESCENLKAEEILDFLKCFASKYELAQHQALVIIVLSHGNDGIICGEDFCAEGQQTNGSFRLTELIDIFSNKNCPLLKGKPKLIFLGSSCNFEKHETNEEKDISDAFIVHSTSRNVYERIKFLKQFAKSINDNYDNSSIVEIFNKNFNNCNFANLHKNQSSNKLELINCTKNFKFNKGFIENSEVSIEILAMTKEFLIKKVKRPLAKTNLFHLKSFSIFGPIFISEIILDAPTISEGTEIGDIIFEVNGHWAFTNFEEYHTFLKEGEMNEYILVNFYPSKIFNGPLDKNYEMDLLSKINHKLLKSLEETKIFSSDNIKMADEVFLVAKITKRIYLVRGKDRDKPAWHYVLVDEDKLKAFIEQSKSGSFDVKDFGDILRSGWGDDAPQSLKDEILDIGFKKYMEKEDKIAQDQFNNDINLLMSALLRTAIMTNILERAINTDD